MTLTKKDIIKLRQTAQTIKPMFQIGKDGLTPTVMNQIHNYLLKHELGKLAILPTCPLEHTEISAFLGLEAIHTVQSIGRNLVIYRANPKLDPKERVI